MSGCPLEEANKGGRVENEKPGPRWDSETISYEQRLNEHACFMRQVASPGLGNTWRIWGWSLRRAKIGKGWDFNRV